MGHPKIWLKQAVNVSVYVSTCCPSCPRCPDVVRQALFERAKQLADGAVLPWGNQSRSTPELIRSGRARSSSTAKGAVAAAGSSEGLEKQARRKWAEAESLSKRAAQQVLQEAQVVCATCSGAGDPLLNNL